MSPIEKTKRGCDYLVTIKTIIACHISKVDIIDQLTKQGVYESENPNFPSVNAYFDGFRYCELASGEVAAPTSPIAPCRESGEIVRNGTAVEIGLYFTS